MKQNEIIELIYDAVVDDGAVRPLAKALADHFHADTNWMLVGVSADTSPAAMCIHGIDEDLVAAYEKTFHRYDPWLALVEGVPENRPASLARWVSTEQFQHSLVYQELLRGRVDVMHCMGLTFRDGATRSSFALQRGKAGAAFDEHDEKRLKPFLPHLRRYVRAVVRKAVIAPCDLNALLAPPDPVIVVDRTACPVHCSPDGAALLDAVTVLGRRSTGRLYSIDPRLVVDKAVRNAALTGIPTVQQVDPPSGSYIVAIDPCPSLPCHASITVRNRQRHVQRKTDEAGHRFDLTNAEKRLLASLLTGHSVEEYSLCHDIAISTVRSQLRSMFAKTGAQRQPELISHVLMTPTR